MQNSSIINFYRAKDFSSAMNITFSFLRQNFKGLGKSLLFFAAPMILLGSILYQEIFVRMINAGAAAIPEANPFGLEDYYGSVNFLVSLFSAMVFMLIGGVLTVSTTYAYIILYQDKQTTALETGEVFKKTLQLFWRNFVTMLLYGIGFILALILLLIPIGLLSAALSFISPILASISLVFYYVGIIVLSIHFSLLFYICCREGIGFFDAITRLNRLSKGKFWSTIWLGGTNLYIQYVLAIVFIVPWYLFFFLTQFHSVSDNVLPEVSSAQGLISTVLFMIYSLGSVLLAVIPLTAFAVQYHHLVEYREARDLISRIATVGVASQGPDAHEDF